MIAAPRVLAWGVALVVLLSVAPTASGQPVNLRAIGGQDLSGADVIDGPTAAVRVTGTIGAPASGLALDATLQRLLGSLQGVAVTPPFRLPVASDPALVVVLSPNSAPPRGLLVPQASPTERQDGPLMQGAVTTAAPTYTTGQTNPLSLTTAGSVRVACTAGCGGGTQYDQGTVSGAADSLTMAGAIRRDTAALDAGVADGDRAALSTDSAGRLRVTAADTTTDNSAFTAGTTTETNIGGVFNDSLAAIASGNAAAARITARRALHVNLRDALGREFERGNPLAVSAIGTVGIKDGADATVVATVKAPFLPVSAADASLVVSISPNSGNAPGVGASATDAPIPTAAHYIAGRGGGRLVGITVCDNWTVINQAAGALLITGSAGRHTYICAINVVTATAQNIALVGGTGSVCATGTQAIAGGTTAATGWNLAANSGVAQGSGVGVIMRAGTAGNDVCLLQSSTGQISGALAWTQF